MEEKMKAEDIILLLMCVFAGLIFSFVWIKIVKGLHESATNRSRSNPGNRSHTGGSSNASLSYESSNHYDDNPSGPIKMSPEEELAYDQWERMKDSDEDSDDEPKRDFFDDFYGLR
jgi:hypothetical protein